MCRKLENFKYKAIVAYVLNLQMLIISGQRSTSTTPIPRFRFEGVDYLDLPPNLKFVNYDCHTIAMECIRHHPHLHPVCAYRILTHHYHDFYNHCEVELENCLHRLYYNAGNFYGVQRDDNKVFYNGEGNNCEVYGRMGMDMDEAYFGGASRELAIVKADMLRSKIISQTNNTKLLSTASLVEMTTDLDAMNLTIGFTTNSS